jgi:hypothetical protein
MDSYINAAGFMVFTEKYLRERGHCCGNNCLHCPYGKLTENTKNQAIKAIDTDELPDFRIGLSAGKLSAALRKMNVNTFLQTARFVCLMPYHRNRDLGNPLNVLSEQRATCSGKHQLLAQLAHENNCNEVQLIIGFYKMTAKNTSRVGAVLEKYGLQTILEAHTYLKYNEKRVDFTTPSFNQNHRFATDLLAEIVIQPQELFLQKTSLHRNALALWAQENGLTARYSIDELWDIREECITALVG